MSSPMLSHLCLSNFQLKSKIFLGNILSQKSSAGINASDGLFEKCSLTDVTGMDVKHLWDKSSGWHGASLTRSLLWTCRITNLNWVQLARPHLYCFTGNTMCDIIRRCVWYRIKPSVVHRLFPFPVAPVHKLFTKWWFWEISTTAILQMNTAHRN